MNYRGIGEREQILITTFEGKCNIKKDICKQVECTFWIRTISIHPFSPQSRWCISQVFSSCNL